MKAVGLFLCLFFTHFIFTDAKRKLFEYGETVGTVTCPKVKEASGICMSRVHTNVLYTHNDSGGKNRIFAFNATTGECISTITINGAYAWDWEDMACSVCPGQTGAGPEPPRYCIYIADTGDRGRGADDIIYRIKEPDSLPREITAELDSYLQFNWTPFDSETLLADDLGEVYVVSKVYHGAGRLVHLPSSAWIEQHNTDVYQVPDNEGVDIKLYSKWDYGPVGGDISRNGKEVLIKTYNHVWYWSVPDRDYYKHMSRAGVQVSCHYEPQGESVGWDDRGSGYYTLGEGWRPTLYYYPRTQPHDSAEE